MYTIVSLQGISTAPRARWGAVDYSTAGMYELYMQYRQLYLTVTTNFFPDPLIVDLNEYRTKYMGFTGTVQDFLTDLGSETLKTVTSIPTYKTGTTSYADVFQSGYKVELLAPNIHATVDVPKVMRTDARLSRDYPATDMRQVHEYCMCSVNGYWHMTDTDGEYLYVKDAGKTNFISQRNTMGLWSFRQIGKIKHIPITLSMIFKQANDSRFYEKTYIKLNESVEGKTALLVLGGYLVLPDAGVFTHVGNDTYSLDISRLPIAERYFDSFKDIDYTSLGLDNSTTNKDKINLAQFYSDPVMKKYLTMSQSFIVLVDTPELFINKYHLHQSPIPCNWQSSFEPKHPLFVANGKVAEYVKTKEDNIWSLRTADGWRQHRVLSELGASQLTNVDHGRSPMRPVTNTSATLVELGSDFIPV